MTQTKVAPQTLNVVAFQPIHFCLLEMDPPTASEKLPSPSPDSAIADGLLDYSVRVVPLDGAWVLIVPSYGDVRDPWLYKTDPTGSLQSIDPSTFTVLDHHEVHSIAFQKALPKDRTLTYAWCQNLTVFQSLVQDYVNDPVTWKEIWPTATMHFAEPEFAALTAPVDQLAFQDLTSQERMRLALLLHNQGPDGDRFFETFPGQFEVDGVSKSHTYFFFARRPAICAMYLAEVITRYATSLSRRSADAYLTFATALTLNSLLIAPYQALLKKQAAKTLTIQERYLIWAHDCGVAHVPISDFQKSLPDPGTNVDADNVRLLAELDPLNNLDKTLKHPVIYPDPDGGYHEPTHEDPYLYFYDTDGEVYQTYAQWRVFAEINDYGDTPQFSIAATRATADAAEVVRRIVADHVLEKSSLLQQFVPEAISQMGTWENFGPLYTRWMGVHLDAKRIWLEAIPPPPKKKSPQSPGDEQQKDEGKSVAKTVALFLEKLGKAQTYYDLVTSFFDTKAAYVARLVAEVPERFPNLLASAKTLQDELVIEHFLNISNLHLKIDEAHGELLVSGLGVGKNPSLGSFKLVNTNGQLHIDPTVKAKVGSLFEGSQEEGLKNIGFSSPLARKSVPAMVGAVGALANLISDVMRFSKLYEENGVVAYFEVAKDMGYAVESIAECTEVVLSLLARSQLTTLRAAVDAAVLTDVPAARARIMAAEGVVNRTLADKIAKGKAADTISHTKTASKTAKDGAADASKLAQKRWNSAVAALKKAEQASDDIENGFPTTQGRELFKAVRDGKPAEEILEIGDSSVVEKLAGFAGDVAARVGMATLPLDVLLVFREGFLTIIDHDSVATKVVGGADVLGAGYAAILIAETGLAAAFAPATLVLASVALVELGVDAYEALFGTPDDELPMEKNLSDAKAQEIKDKYTHTWDAQKTALGLKANTPFVCNTQAGLLSLAAGLAKVLAL